jgi:hypothetical protein
MRSEGPSMKASALARSDPKLLSELIGLESGEQKAWNVDELGAVLRHQLSAPMNFHLSGLDKGVAARLATLADSQQLLLKSFSDLLLHPNPPLELLKLVKDFAKFSSSHPDSPLPQAVAYVLYYAAIVAARVSCGQRITTLDDASLRQSLELTLTRPWLEESVRALLQRGIALLDESR